MNGQLLFNSVLMSLGVATLSSALGFCFALWFACLRPRMRWILCGLAAASLAMPPFIATGVWIRLFGNNAVLGAALPWNIYSVPGVVFVLTLLTWPVAGLLLAGVLNGFDRQWLDQETLLAGGSLIRHGVLPHALGALKLAFIVGFALAFANFSVPALLQVKVFPAELWIQFNTTFDFGAALRTGWPILAVAAAASWLLFAGGFTLPSNETEAAEAGLFRRRLGEGWFYGCGAAAAGLIGCSLAVPFGMVLLDGQTWLQLPGAFSAGTGAIWNTLRIAACVGLAVLLLGGALWRKRGVSFAWMLFWTPGIVLGLLTIFLFNRSGLQWIYPSLALVVLAMALRYAAIGWSGLHFAFRSVDSEQLDAARLSGAGHWQQVLRVCLPQCRARVAAAGYVIYLLCLWDVETLLLILPPGGETLAVRVFNLLHYGHNQEVNALSLILFGLAVLPLLLWGAGKGLLGIFERRSPSSKTWRLQLGTKNTILLGGLLMGLSGCSNAPDDANVLQSKIFSSVEVIGRRGAGAGEFNKPRSVAVDGEDNLYVVDMTGRVQKFSSDGEYLLSWQMPEIERGKPKGMCRDREGRIVVVEPHYSRVNYFSTEGRLLAQWGEPGEDAGRLTLPRAAAVNSEGELFVSEYSGAERVQKFNGMEGEWLAAWGGLGGEAGQFNRPEGLGVDGADRLYVADSCNHRIQVFDSEGRSLDAFGRAGNGPNEFSYPYDVKIDSAGRQYVCEFGNSRIQVFDPGHECLEIIGGPGTLPGRFSNPWSIALDSKNNLYVADSMNHRIQKLIARPAADVESKTAYPGSLDLAGKSDDEWREGVR